MSGVWHTVEIGPDSFLVQDGDRVVGAIMREDGKFCAAIMWGGATIVGNFSDYTAALAFVEGVEKTFLAFNASV